MVVLAKEAIGHSGHLVKTLDFFFKFAKRISSSVLANLTALNAASHSKITAMNFAVVACLTALSATSHSKLQV